VGTRAKRLIAIADSVRSGTTLRERVRIRTGTGGGKGCGRLAGSTCCGAAASFCTSGKAILLVAFMLDPRDASAHFCERAARKLIVLGPEFPRKKNGVTKCH